MLEYYLYVKMGNVYVFVLSLFLTIRMALMVIVAQFLGMGMDAPWERVVTIAYTAKTKGLLNVKKNIRGCSPPGRNTCCCC